MKFSRLRFISRGARVRGGLAVALVVCALLATPPALAADTLPSYLQDRGEGIPTSMFGTYVANGERIAYLFYEYTLNRDQEYKPAELGFGLDEDFRAKLTEHEFLLFYAFGLSDNLEIEVESALHATATQEKAANDPSAMPSRLRESGLGDTEGQLRWRWTKESVSRPEVFSYTEVVLPLQKKRVLIGTQDWELAQGFGLIKGSGFGTFTLRAAVSYSAGESVVEFGEYAIDYLKRASDRWCFTASIEGEQDEVAAIAEVQLHLGPDLFFKLNDAIGLTDKAPDQAPEVGIVLGF